MNCISSTTITHDTDTDPLENLKRRLQKRMKWAMFWSFVLGFSSGAWLYRAVLNTIEMWNR